MQIKRWSRAELWWEDPMCWKQKVVWIGQLQAGSANYKLLTLIFWLNLTKTSDQMDSTTARSDWLSPTLTLSFVSSQLLSLKSWTGKCNTRRTRFNQAGSVSGLTRLTRVSFTTSHLLLAASVLGNLSGSVRLRSKVIASIILCLFLVCQEMS